jgi:hypothetical protein
MARNDWVAVVTDPGAEYLALTELNRLGLRVYLPQGRKLWHHVRASTALLRRYPVFPGYILLPLRDAKPEVLRLCRGVRRIRPILSTSEGHLWRAPATVIDAVRESEDRGDFDEVLATGDPIKLAKGVLAGVQAVLTETACRGRVEILMPLFGGVKASVPQGNVMPARDF